MRKAEAARGSVGFTLIELLVVIFVVGLLVVLSLPAMKQAILSSEASKCAGNLRTIGAAMRLYVQDNGNVMPQRFYPNAVPTTGYDVLLLPYAGNERYVFRCPSLQHSDFPTQPSYGMNWYYDNVSVLIAPGRTILAAESAGNDGGGSHRADRDSGAPGQLDPTRHGGRANYLFFDGHVEMLKFADTLVPADLWGTDQGRHNESPPGTQ